MSLTFSKKHIVQPDEIDALRHVNNVIYVSWIQEIANEHWNILKEGHHTDECIWVVLRHEIDYIRQAVLGDEITINTWVGHTAGAKSVRHVEIARGGKVLVRAQTTYCLLDANTFKPTRIGADILFLLGIK